MCFSALKAKITGEEISRIKIFTHQDLQLISFSDDLDPKKTSEIDGRFYPKWWTQVLVAEETSLSFRPMRYQLLPHFCSEDKYQMVNPKTNRKKEIKTYNARIDGLATRNAWKSIFGVKHALIPLAAFYEWVKVDGKARQIEFRDKNKGPLWAACLWDRWAKDGQEIDSFAIITDEGSREIQQAGHDRMPIFLQEENLENWLRPKKTSGFHELLKILKHPKKTFFQGR